MAGPVPAIHDSLHTGRRQFVDVRPKAGHDGIF
jgi:hypothetical protein